MYTLVNKLRINMFLLTEMPSLGISWIIAELLYKFGSFIMEQGAFLATWHLAGLGFHLMLGKKNN
jgi:hypothetical protein